MPPERDVRRPSIEIVDRDGAPIPGFSGDAATVREKFDDLRWQLRWGGDVGLASLRGKVVRLQFHLRNAQLYAFQVQ